MRLTKTNSRSRHQRPRSESSPFTVNGNASILGSTHHLAKNGIANCDLGWRTFRNRDFLGPSLYCSTNTFQIEYVAMDTGIQIQTIWCDADVTEIVVSAWNGTFGGVTRIYVGIGALKEAAEQLCGFPKSPTDIREVAFGQFDLKPVRVGQSNVDVFASGISMRFHCVNGAGHAYLDLRLQSENRGRTSVGPGERPNRTIQTVALVMRIEATAVDTFVQELLRLEATHAGTAHLRALASDGE